MIEPHVYPGASSRCGCRMVTVAGQEIAKASLLDVGGNVWERTATFFIRATLDDGPMRVTNTNCGVRVVQGAHRTYMTDFIRDPRTGGRAADVPPTNLGFRRVVESRWPVVSATLDALVGVFGRT